MYDKGKMSALTHRRGRDIHLVQKVEKNKDEQVRLHQVQRPKIGRMSILRMQKLSRTWTAGTHSDHADIYSALQYSSFRMDATRATACTRSPKKIRIILFITSAAWNQYPWSAVHSVAAYAWCSAFLRENDRANRTCVGPRSKQVDPDLRTQNVPDCVERNRLDLLVDKEMERDPLDSEKIRADGKPNLNFPPAWLRKWIRHMHRKKLVGSTHS